MSSSTPTQAVRSGRIRIIAINVVLLLLVAGAGLWGYMALHPKAAATSLSTTTVTTGDVQATVSATGKVISPSDVGLAPLAQGTLKSLNVKVGDVVRAGQVLAQLDTTNLTTALDQAQASLVTAKAAIAALTPTKSAAEQAQAALQLSQAQAAVDSAKKSAADQTTLLSTNAATYQASVDAAKTALDNATANAALSAKQYQSSVDRAHTTLQNYLDIYGPGGISTAFCQTTSGQNNICVTELNDYNAWQDALTTQTANLLKDKQNLDNLNTAYQNALISQKNNLAKDAVTAAGYQSQITSAQNSLDNLVASQAVANQPAKQSAVDSAAAQLTTAQANFDQAKRNLAAATIVAPVGGTVASISTAVGGSVSTNSTPASATANASGFIVLTNVSTLEVTGSFSEADAAKVIKGQSATFTFDALPNVNATGKVSYVDILPTTSSGATTYTATFTLDGSVPGLKPGMTATATVIVGEALNVTQVSAQAVTSLGGSSTVRVVTTVKGKQVITPTPVVIGLKGDSADEIQSGVKPGAVVALPTVTRTTSSNGFAVGGVPGGVTALAGAGTGGGFGGGGRNGG